MDILKRLRRRSWISALVIGTIIYTVGFVTSLEFNPLRWLVFDMVVIRLVLSIGFFVAVAYVIQYQQKQFIYYWKRPAIRRAKKWNKRDSMRYEVFCINKKYFVINALYSDTLKESGEEPIFKTE